MYDDDFHYPSETELDNAEAWELGAANPDKAWVCTNRDVIHANPHYHGPPVPHPDWEGTDEEWAEYQERLKKYPGINHPNDDYWGGGGVGWDEPEEIPF